MSPRTVQCPLPASCPGWQGGLWLLGLQGPAECVPHTGQPSEPTQGPDYFHHSLYERSALTLHAACSAILRSCVYLSGLMSYFMSTLSNQGEEAWVDRCLTGAQEAQRQKRGALAPLVRGTSLSPGCCTGVAPCPPGPSFQA